MATKLTGESRKFSAITTVNIRENHIDQTLGNTIVFKDMEGTLLKGQSIDMYDQTNLSQILSDNAITDDITIQWSSSDEDIASIDQTGRLTGLKEGTTTVTAVVTAMDGEGQLVGEYPIETEIKVTEIPLESIAFDKIIKEMLVGATDVLHILYNPENTTDLRDVEWATSDANVLSVENGKLTALKPGTATITAKVGDKEVSCEILVKAVEGQGADQENGTRMENGSGSGTATEINAGDVNSVRTGDTANIIPYIALLAGAIVAFTFVIIWRKRKLTR